MQVHIPASRDIALLGKEKENSVEPRNSRRVKDGAHSPGNTLNILFQKVGAAPRVLHAHKKWGDPPSKSREALA